MNDKTEIELQLDGLELLVADGELSAAKLFTKMKYLVQNLSGELQDLKQLSNPEDFEKEFQKIKSSVEIGRMNWRRALDIMKDAVQVQAKMIDEQKDEHLSKTNQLNMENIEIKNQLKTAIETKAEQIVEYYNSASEEDSFEAPNPIFSMAEHIDWLKKQIRDLKAASK